LAACRTKRVRREGGKEMRIVRLEIREEVCVAGELEKFAANGHGDHLDIAQLRSEALCIGRVAMRCG
jgi:hypothetical protein